ncbi:MAG: hypothetical protein IT370_02070 [Deltaproteobacteria bacterium]|nr:hypothetical protein [Deltaproteobacteria bacterium]
MKLGVAILIEEAALRTRVERALAGRLETRPGGLEVVLTDAAGLREAPRPGPGRELVLLCEQDGRRAALELLARSRVHHLVPIDDGLEAWLAILMRRLARPALCTGLGAQLGAAEVTQRQLGSADDKGRALEELGALASQVLRHAMLADLLVAAVDEMCINALYRAGSGVGAPTRLEWALDDDWLGVAVRDGAGALGAGDIFMGLALALAHEQGGLPPGARSAALGFRIMLGGLSALSIDVDRGRATEVVGALSRRCTLGEHRRRAPAFSLLSR